MSKLELCPNTVVRNDKWVFPVDKVQGTVERASLSGSEPVTRVSVIDGVHHLVRPQASIVT